MRAVIFDMDGTLVDTVDMHAEAWQRAFRAYRKDLDFATVRSQIGKGGDQLMPVFLSPAELAAFGAALDHWRSELFKHEYLPQARAFPHVRDLVERLQGDGIQVALASSASQVELAHYLQLTGLTGMLDGTTSADDVRRVEARAGHLCGGPGATRPSRSPGHTCDRRQPIRRAGGGEGGPGHHRGVMRRLSRGSFTGGRVHRLVPRPRRLARPLRCLGSRGSAGAPVSGASLRGNAPDRGSRGLGLAPSSPWHRPGSQHLSPGE